MSETIYNIYLHLDADDVCHELSFTPHEWAGSDDDAFQFLRNAMSDDFDVSLRVKLDTSFSLNAYYSRWRLGIGHLLFDPIFKSGGANETGLFVATVVRGGRPAVDLTLKGDDTNIYLNTALMGGGIMDDWMIKYKTSAGIDVPKLIDDDYISPVRLLFREGKFLSSMKLLLIAIDTFGFIEFGNKKRKDQASLFVQWLNSYVDLTPVHITAEELWEMRNGLLHMSNLNADRVNRMKVRRISFYVSSGSIDVGREQNGIFYFEYSALMRALSFGLTGWFKSYNQEGDKFVEFVERYDGIVADGRVTRLDG